MDRNLSLGLQSLIHPPYELLKLSSDKYLTWKLCFILALVLAKKISEFHGLSFHFRHLHSWKSCTLSFFLDFLAKTRTLLYLTVDSRSLQFLDWMTV